MDLKEQMDKQNIYDQKPWLFKPGQSGNPKGRPKGKKSLKTYAKEYLQSLSPEEKMEYMKGMDKKVVWEMAEGKAEAKTDVTTGGEKINNVIVLPNIDDADSMETTTETSDSS